MGLSYSDLNGIVEVFPNKEYKIRVTTGQRVRKTIHGNLIKAINEKKKLINDLKNNTIDNNQKRAKRIMENIIFEEAVNRTFEYLTYLSENTDAIDINTVAGYYGQLDAHIYKFFDKNSKLSAINEDKIREFVSFLFTQEKKEGGLLSVSTVERIYSAFSWIIRYCSEIADPPLLPENYLKKIVFKSMIPKGRSIERKKSKSKSSQELKDFIGTLNHHANIRLKSFVSIELDTGCRDEECIALRWKNIDFTTGGVYYEYAVTSSVPKKFSLEYSGPREKSLKSKHSYRTNYLTYESLQNLIHLREFKKALGLSVEEDDYIFTPWTDNTVLSPYTLASEYSRFAKKVGITDLSIYVIRHSLSNILQESGVSAKDVAQYLGNTPRTLLESYTDIREETEIQVGNIIHDKIRSGKYKAFDIETIVNVLNYNEEVINDKVYLLLDFVSNKKVSEDETFLAITNAKNLILEQYPIFKDFCGKDNEIIKAKLETYKLYNSENIELVQDSNYYFPKTNAYQSINI